MAILIYRGLQMKIVHTREISRVAVMSRDGVDYLYTKWTFDCDVVLNPGATAFTKTALTRGAAGSFQVPDPALLVGQGQPLPSITESQTLPVITDASIRGILSRPCGQLIYAPDNASGPPLALLVAPPPGYATDANNGPAVMVNGITAVHGSRTFIVSLKIVAHVNEVWEVKVNRGRTAAQRSAGAVLSYPVLISHRFRQSHDVDEDYRLTLVTEGEAVFNAGELYKFNGFADDYRSYLLPGCPAGFRRLKITPLTAENYCTYRYQVVDREENIALSPGDSGKRDWVRVVNRQQIGMTSRWAAVDNATRCEVYHKRFVDHPNWVNSLSPGSLAGAALAGDPGPNRNLRGNGIAPRAVGMVASAAQSVLSTAFSTFPTFTETIMVRVWGHKASTRKDLEIIAMYLALSRVFPPRTETSTTASIEHNVVGKFVEYQQTNLVKLASSAMQAIGGLFGANVNNPYSLVMMMPDSDDTPYPAAAAVTPAQVPEAAVPPLRGAADVAQLRDQGTRQDRLTVVRQPPLSNGTRGWWPGAIRASVPATTLPSPQTPDGGPTSGQAAAPARDSSPP